MILHLTPTTASLLGETPAEWEALEAMARRGSWTVGRRGEEERLRRMAEALGVAVRVEETRMIEYPYKGWIIEAAAVAVDGGWTPRSSHGMASTWASVLHPASPDASI